jgi:transposase
METTACRCSEFSDEIAVLKTQIAQLAQENRWMKEQFLLARNKQFGTKSERIEIDLNQLGPLFNESELVVGSSPKEALEEKTIIYTRKKKSVGHRGEVLADLPVETIDYELCEEERICPCCGGTLHEMSAKTREELVIVPAKVKVVRHVRHVYACRHCDRNETETPIVTAPAPKPIIEKSLASASAIAQIMGMKYVESMPLYRIEKHFAHFGVELRRAILSNWMVKGGELLEPIYDRMKEQLLTLAVAHADETVLQVLREDGRKAQSDSYMWLYRSGSTGPPILGQGSGQVVLYEYQPTRNANHPHKFLLGFAGYLHTDGYAGYNGIPGVTLVGCWAHARRYYVDAQKILPKEEKENPKHLVNIALGYIQKLFEIEEKLADVTPEQRKAGREELSRPIVEEYKAWLDIQVMRALPKSALGKAIGYSLGQWTKLTVYLTDGRLEISNNKAERSIKPFVIGRKNWLFANTPKGARTSAVIYSIVETAKENGLNPYTYLEYVLDRLREINPTDNVAIDELLPWNETVRSTLARMPHSTQRSP